jgi:hypothetical protein
MAIQDGKCDSPDKTQIEQLACEQYKRIKLALKIIEEFKETDEHMGDATETYESLQWVLSGGEIGKNWGHTYLEKTL